VHVLLELEAVLRTEQLADVRAMVDVRLTHLPEADRWRIVLVVDELVTFALVAAGGCAGLRLLEQPDGAVRVEVDHREPGAAMSGPADDAVRRVLGTIGRGWGDHRLRGHEPDGSDRDPDGGRTLWCDVAMSSPGTR
jgi:hypothetical protein